MSGHSKWANIKNKKAKVDAARGVTFQKFAREIITASRLGGPDPAGNFRLRTAIDRAKAAGLPNDNIKRAIDKASGSNTENYVAVRYEGYGPGAVPFIVEALTDNPRRTVPEVRNIFAKNGGNMGEEGSVVFMFTRAGQIMYPASIGKTEDEMMEIDGGCGLRVGCNENCTCKGGGSYQPSCGDKGNNNGTDNTISIPWPCFGKKK